MLPLKALGRCFPWVLQPLLAPGVPRFVAATLQALCLSLHGLLPLCVSVPNLPLPVIGFKVPPKFYKIYLEILYLIISAKTPFLNRFAFIGTRVGMWTQLLGSPVQL